MDESAKSLMVLMESLGDWSNATMLAEYDVNRNTVVKNSTKIATRMDIESRFIVYPVKHTNTQMIPSYGDVIVTNWFKVVFTDGSLKIIFF